MTCSPPVSVAAFAATGALTLSIAACSGTDEPTQPPPPSNFAVRISAAPVELGALVVAIQGGGPKRIAIVAGTRSRVAQVAGSDGYRALVFGASLSGDIATIALEGIDAGIPTAVVIEAAAGATGGYAPIAPAAVRLSVVAK